MGPAPREGEPRAGAGGLASWPTFQCCWGPLPFKSLIFGFSEDEKDDGIAMSVVSSEAVKSPPNGDHVEAQAAQIDCPPVPGVSSDLFQPAEEGEMDVWDSRGGPGCRGKPGDS